MQIIGISGLPGSGKSLVSEKGIEKGATIVSMGDIIRNEAKKRGESTKTTAIKLRQEFGDCIVAELTIKEIKKINEEGFDGLVIVEGIRSLHEVKMFKENFENFKIVSVFANPEIRFKRIQERNRADDSNDINIFNERDERELNFGIGKVISLSDKLLINESSLEDYINKIEEFYEELGI